MGGTLGRAGLALGTMGMSEFIQKNPYGIPINNPFSRLNPFKLGGEDGYTPQMLPNQDPKLILAQSGGTPLLTQIVLGANVEDALAGYFGRSTSIKDASGNNDWSAYLNGLNPDERAAIYNVRDQLTQIQKNTDLRNQTIQNLVNDFPNVVSMTAPKVLAAKQAAGEEFDQATQNAMKLATDQLAAKQASSGLLSSGASAAAAARIGAGYGLQRLDYQNQRGNQQLGLQAQDWQNQYNEANALRNFQQTMLGQGVQQGFSANQAMLNRQQQTNMANTQSQNQAQMFNIGQENAMTSQLFGAAGSLAGAYIGGNMIAGAIGKQAAGNMSQMTAPSFPQGQSQMNMPFNYPNYNPNTSNRLSLY